MPEKNLESKTQKLMTVPNRIIVPEPLIESCEEFIEKIKRNNYHYNLIYEKGEETAKKIGYTREDVEELSRIITPEALITLSNPKYRTKEDVKDINDHFRLLGFYLSALVNRVIKAKEKITLETKIPLHGLGAYLPKGTLIIDSDAGDHAGFKMRGGRLILLCRTGDHSGTLMDGGMIYFAQYKKIQRKYSLITFLKKGLKY